MKFLFIIFLFLIQNQTVFSQQFYEKILYPFDGLDIDYFGRSIAVSDSFLFVSSLRYENPVDAAIYFYKFENNDYRFISKIYPNDPEEGALFGGSLLYENHKLYVGARNKKVNNIPVGVVYVFEYTNNNWVQIQKIIPPEPHSFQSSFSNDIALFKDYLLIGAFRADNDVEDGGKAFLYKRNIDQFEFVQDFSPNDPQKDQNFGISLLINENLIVIGASRDSTESGVHSGSIYIFAKIDSSWTFNKKYIPELFSSNLSYGCDLALSDEYIFVGTADNIYYNSYGRVYAYKYNSSVLELEQIINSGEFYSDDRFGITIHSRGDSLFVGSISDTVSNFKPGSIYLFVNESGHWIKKRKIIPSNPDKARFFGSCCITTDDKFIVGAHLTNNGANSTGAVYIYSNEPLTNLRERENIPKDFDVLQNYPNPFNPMTNISFYILNSDLVRITVHNSVGEEIIELENGIKQSGFHTVTFNGKSLASGVYIYSLKVGENSESKKMVLMK